MDTFNRIFLTKRVNSNSHGADSLLKSSSGGGGGITSAGAADTETQERKSPAKRIPVRRDVLELEPITMTSLEAAAATTADHATTATMDHGYDVEVHSRHAPESQPSTSKQKGLQHQSSNSGNAAGGLTKIGLIVLLICAVQNCAKTLVMRFVMKDQPKFLTSAAVLGSECIKMTCSVGYILFIQKRSLGSIFQFLKDDMRNTMLLLVPASAYNFQTSMEYVALANLNAATFSVLVQTKLLTTAIFSVAILRKQLKYIQVISLVLLTVGVMMCNLKTGASSSSADEIGNTTKGIMATLGIALSSGFASVYTEKVIKGTGVPRKVNMDDYGLAYTQVQLAGMSILAIGIYAVAQDWNIIVEHGMFYNFTKGAALSCFMSGMGGLVVASVLKYADSILKGYATALSVVMTGILSVILFGTQLSTIYYLGILNVICAVLLYNGKNLDQFICKK
mmetsp:Transcript_20027/g.25805  ORF Transcript_20027/g.25805 Transcript_20027/m.25805 type:complete len:450 (+) Transcript_20027:151-1500(+)